MEVNIQKILEQCAGLEYVVLRNSYDFNKYPVGSDIDILTKDIPSLINVIMQELNNYTFSGYTINKTWDNSHVHLDVSKDGILIVRFDIIDSMTLDTNSLVNYLIVNKQNKKGIMFPDEVGDMFTRLMEYFNNPTKVNHLDFVKDIIK